MMRRCRSVCDAVAATVVLHHPPRSRCCAKRPQGSIPPGIISIVAMVSFAAIIVLRRWSDRDFKLERGLEKAHSAA